MARLTVLNRINYKQRVISVRGQRNKWCLIQLPVVPPSFTSAAKSIMPPKR